MLEFRIEGLPPSYNEHFQIIWHLKECYLSPEARMFKNKVKLTVPHFKFENNTYFKMEIHYHDNFIQKNGKNKRIDLQNLNKCLIDAIFEKLGIDDSFVWELFEKKVQSLTSFTLVRLEPIFI
jgi:Holliday junction resolvase RusA-like endonuclease